MTFTFKDRRAWQRYLFALLAVAAAAALRVEFLGLLGSRTPYVTFYPAVMIVALFTGVGPGLLATALAASWVAYWLEPPNTLFIQDPADRLALAVFMLSCVMFCIIAKVLHNAQKRTAEAEAAARLSEQRRQSETKLRESEVRYNALFDNDIIGIAHCRVIADDSGRPVDYRILQVNTAYERILGIKKADIEGRRVTEVFPGVENYAFDYIGVLGKVGLEGGEISAETFLETTGQYLSIYAYSPLPSEFTTILTDVTERRQMEAKLRASEAHYRLLTEDVSDVVWKLDRDYRFTYLSPADERLRGYRAEQVIGSTIFEAMTEEAAAHLRDFLPAGRDERGADQKGPVTFEAQQRCQDGKLIWTEVLCIPERDPEGTITGFHGISRDVTERKQKAILEQQLLHAQKFESLGVLAGGIAHDFNNILMAIIGNADLALMGLDQESPVQENLRRMRQAAERAAELTKQMLAYSGKGRFVKKNLDLNRLLQDTLNMLEASGSKKAVIKLHLAEALPSVEADAAQMQQILMNLVVNASEAIGEENGVIDITTGCRDCDRDFLKGLALDKNVKEGRYVFVEVADTGCGMSKETLARVFDPFFSTKFAGRGLGMAALQGIVKGHKGYIEVDSELGKGTTFKVLLPALDRSADLPVPRRPGQGTGDDWHGAGIVLLVDDEESVRSTGVEMLRSLGFTPITASDGLEAMEIFRKRSDIAFVILDLTMPRMDGEQCFREMRKLDPRAKVIMSSGYNEREVTEKFSGEALSGFIHKPYTLAELKDAIGVLI